MPSLMHYADPFWGTEQVDLPAPAGIAAAWQPIKAMLGGNDPGAALPFGKLTCSPFTGGFSSGYGTCRPSCGGPVEPLAEGMRFKGVTHIHHDGTGYVPHHFFNYILTMPHGEDTLPAPRAFASEQAHPGYYGCTLSDGIACELTVGEKGALHRYTFPADSGRITVDLAAAGLDCGDPGTETAPTAGTLRLIAPDTAVGSVTLLGVTLYVALHCRGAAAARLTGDGDTAVFTDPSVPFGVTFTVPHTCELAVTVTAKDEALALAELATLPDFDTVHAAAVARWEQAFSLIEIEGDDTAKTVFASALYHSLIKPTDWSGEGLWGIDGDCMIDLMTLWDMNKTALPLMLTLFPERGRQLLHSILAVFDKTGLFPNCLILTGDTGLENQQARALAAFTIADAYYRGIADKELTVRLLRAAESVIFRPENADFLEQGRCEYASHEVDLAEAMRSMAAVAREVGETALAERFAAHQDKWRGAYGPDGLMRADSSFYEGSRFNYSFRLHGDMEERIALCGREAFVAHLDRFFGFTHPEDKTARFEGFNNETDMETPYAYHYAGRYDRLCAVLDAQYRYCYAPGRGGAPGEVDSGAMSSCYVWNCLGLFPVSGQDLVLLGKPAFAKAVIHLPGGKTLTVLRQGDGDTVTGVTLDGEPVPSRTLTVRRLMQGGTVTFL